tara:strand:+ start:83 stop:436 length:354 start_codon:yes stop_codon:yes gene_type:complete
MNRYSNIRTIRNSQGKRYYPIVKYPDIPLSPDDAYIICNSTDRYDKLAQDYYGDSSLWWIISIANNASPQNSLFPPLESYVRIPGNYVDILANFNTLNSTNNNTNNNTNNSSMIGTY